MRHLLLAVAFVLPLPAVAEGWQDHAGRTFIAAMKTSSGLAYNLHVYLSTQGKLFWYSEGDPADGVVVDLVGGTASLYGKPVEVHVIADADRLRFTITEDYGGQQTLNIVFGRPCGVTYIYGGTSYVSTSCKIVPGRR